MPLTQEEAKEIATFLKIRSADAQRKPALAIRELSISAPVATPEVATILAEALADQLSTIKTLRLNKGFGVTRAGQNTINNAEVIDALSPAWSGAKATIQKIVIEQGMADEVVLAVQRSLNAPECSIRSYKIDGISDTALIDLGHKLKSPGGTLKTLELGVYPRLRHSPEAIMALAQGVNDKNCKLTAFEYTPQEQISGDTVEKLALAA